MKRPRLAGRWLANILSDSRRDEPPEVSDEPQMTIEESIRALGPWFHQIKIKGYGTRDIAPAPGPQRKYKDFPLFRWQAIKDHLPDLKGARVLDVGCADGFFSIEMARLGAKVDAIDRSADFIKRLRWAANELELDINARVSTVEDVSGSYDFILFLAVLYHLKGPLVGLEKLSAMADTMLLETTLARVDGPYMWFKPPQPGVHPIPKWFPSADCVEAMLEFVGYKEIERLPYERDNTGRGLWMCRK